MNWIQIGAVAGPTIELPSVALRSANFRLQGSGQGAVSPRAYLAELPSLVAEITAGTIAVTATTMPLADVEQIWPGPKRPASAHAVVQLAGDDDATGRALAAAAAESNIVLDYLWGKPAQQAIPALLTARSDRSREMNWIQIGSVAGPAMELPSAALRSASFRLQGSGQGSVSPRAYLAELPSLVAEITAGTIAVTATTMPLADVEQIWPKPEAPGERTVLVP